MPKKLPRGARTLAVREYLKKNPTAKVKDVVAELAKTGMTVSEGLVNVVKYKKAKRKKVVERASSEGVDIKQLIAVKKLADQIGGLARMRSALSALEQLQ